MFIKFNDFDMLDFFDNEPICVGEEGEAIFIYSINGNNQFSMTLTVDTYAKQVGISISYIDNIIFDGEFNNVRKIKKESNIMIVCMDSGERVIIKKDYCPSVILENI